MMRSIRRPPEHVPNRPDPGALASPQFRLFFCLVGALASAGACKSGSGTDGTGAAQSAKTPATSPSDGSEQSGQKKADVQPGAQTGDGAPVKAREPARLRVVVSVDWEGAYLSEEGMAALAEFRQRHPRVPITHWVTPAYFTKPEVADTLVADMQRAFVAGDDVALHIHAWKSLAEAAQVEPKLAPSFLGDAGELLEFEDGDKGYEVELGAYGTDEFRAILKKSMSYLQPFDPKPFFRAGGALVAPHIFAALAAEGFTIDSSAMRYQDFREAHGATPQQRKRLRANWGEIDEFAMPYMVATAHGPIIEVPSAPGFGDYASASELEAFIERAAAHIRANPDRDVYIHLGFHQETAHATSDAAPWSFSKRVSKAVHTLEREHGAFVTYETFSDIARRHSGLLEAKK